VEPTLDDAKYFEHCAQRRLAFQRCAACKKLRHPPGPICPACQSDAIEWVDAPDDARIYTYTIARHPAHPAAAPVLPYNVVVVDFPSLPGVRLISNVIDARPEQLSVGLPLALVWDEGSNGQLLPRFRLQRPAV
jgi:uncharacterized OB-fold protein